MLKALVSQNETNRSKGALKKMCDFGALEQSQPFQATKLDRQSPFLFIHQLRQFG